MASGMAYIWLALMVVLLIIEAAVPGLVSIWFAIGALAALIAAFLHAALWLQIVCFIVVSIAALCLTRPLAKKFVNSRVHATNADAVIGKECIVTEDIDNIKGKGAVMVAGKVWTARTEDDTVKLAKDSRAVVLRIEGVKLIVK